MRRAAAMAGAAVLAAAWAIAAARHGFASHMAAHMAAVAVAAPLLAYGLAGTALDAAARFPRAIAPLPMSLVELAVVWGWHAPAARTLAAADGLALAMEQAMFLGAGFLLWNACLGACAAARARRGAAILALLLTTMHMTLLGVLLALAPRTLFGTHGSAWLGVALGPLADQQLGGVIMLLVGGGNTLLGALVLLAALMRAERAEAVPPWS